MGTVGKRCCIQSVTIWCCRVGGDGGGIDAKFNSVDPTCAVGGSDLNVDDSTDNSTRCRRGDIDIRIIQVTVSLSEGSMNLMLL